MYSHHIYVLHTSGIQISEELLSMIIVDVEVLILADAHSDEMLSIEWQLRPTPFESGIVSAGGDSVSATTIDVIPAAPVSGHSLHDT